MVGKTGALVGGMFVFVLIGLIAADLYMSYQIEIILSTTSENVILWNETWTQIQKERLGTILFSSVVFLIVWFIVLKIGIPKRNVRKVTQKEALEIAKTIMAEHKEKGRLLMAKEETINQRKKR